MAVQNLLIFVRRLFTPNSEPRNGVSVDSTGQTQQPMTDHQLASAIRKIKETFPGKGGANAND